MLEVYESNADIQSFLDAVEELKEIEASIPAFQEEMTFTLELSNLATMEYDVTEEVIPGVHDVRSFIMGFRQFYLEKDSTHFGKASGLAIKLANDELLKLALIRSKNLYFECLNSKPFDFQIVRLPSIENVNGLLNHFFNGGQFHRDQDKTNALKVIKGTNQYRFTYYMFVAHLKWLFKWIKVFASVIQTSDNQQLTKQLYDELKNARGPLVDQTTQPKVTFRRS